MKKILSLLFLTLIFTSVCSAEDIYCGDFNGKPAYIELESIEITPVKGNLWIVKQDGIFYPGITKSYSANLLADGVWYKVYFNEGTKTSYLATILDKDKKNTGKHIVWEKFNFAYQTVIDNYPESIKRNEEKSRMIDSNQGKGKPPVGSNKNQ